MTTWTIKQLSRNKAAGYLLYKSGATIEYDIDGTRAETHPVFDWWPYEFYSGSAAWEAFS